MPKTVAFTEDESYLRQLQTTVVTRGARKKRVSKPERELPAGMLAKNCTEMYLSGRGIEKIGNFERFVNLEVLWLNGNRLHKVKRLDSNVRLRELYLQGNHLVTVQGSLSKLKHLEVLMLQENQLRDMRSVVADLQHLTSLRRLNLFGNPMAEEEGYREYLIAHMPPSLEILDRHAITPAERRGRVAPPARVVAAPARRKGENLSATVRDVERYAARLRKERAEDARRREEEMYAELEKPAPVANELPPPPGWVDVGKSKILEPVAEAKVAEEEAREESGDQFVMYRVKEKIVPARVQPRKQGGLDIDVDLLAQHSAVKERRVKVKTIGL